MKHVAWLMVAAAALGLTNPQQARAIAPICVLHNDSVGLARALGDVAASGVSTQIEVEQGVYTVPPGGWTYFFHTNQDVALLGGFVPGTGCQQRHITASPTTTSTNTVLDGAAIDGTAIALYSLAEDGAYGRLTFEGFEVRNLKNVSGGSGAAILDLYWDTADSDTGGVVFRYNWVHGNTSSGYVVELQSGGALDVTNNLVDQNTGSAGVTLSSSVANTAPWRIVHNTIAQNSGRGLSLFHYAGDYLQFFNNILYGNTSTDLVANSAAEVELHGDTYGVASGTNIVNHGYAFGGTNPGYDANYHLVSGSSSLNSGAAYAALLPPQDLDGNPRWYASNPDRGAFENNAEYDQSNFLVNDNADLSAADNPAISCQIFSSTCTLREAIIEANNAHTLGRYIYFNLGSSCGQAILLTSPLPTITVPMTVDGFSQPGSVHNTVAPNSGVALDEKLCVIVEGAINSNVASAFFAGPSNTGAQLEVRGISFEGFGVAISLSNGSNHWIHGNSFGIETDANPFVFSNGGGVYIGGAATFSTVGGPGVADLNLFGKMTNTSSAAIVIAASPANGHLNHSVGNNLIGVGTDQSTAVANQGAGILLDGSPWNEVYGNVVVANASDGVRVSSASNNWLHDNSVGTVGNLGTVAALKNGGSGITLLSGAAQNRIGVADPDIYLNGTSNRIQNNGGPGVWLQTGAGVGNSVLGNAIGFNGPNMTTGDDLAIDLGALGTPLGSGTVPNGALAAATIYRSYLIGFARLQSDFSVTGTGGDDYRVDFYANHQCGANGYGPAETPLHAYRFTMPGSGAQTLEQVMQMPIGAGISQAPAYVTAVVTDISTGNTAQVSNCATFANDRVFASSFEASVVNF